MATRSLKVARTSQFLAASSRQSAISLSSQPRLDSEKLQAGPWSKVHTTHKGMLLNGRLYCRKCGLFNINQVEGLALACNGAPKNNYGKAQLTKLKEGKHPVRAALARTFTPIPIDRL